MIYNDSCSVYISNRISLGLGKTDKKLYLQVTHGHSLFIDSYGDPQGKAILFLHGGPGLGWKESDTRFFDPSKHFVIFVDQRGSGKSTYKDLFFKNDTDSLLKDIKQVLDHFSINKVWMFGGSWGSTLALLFAIQNPNRVAGLILRGLFLADKNSLSAYSKNQSKNNPLWSHYIKGPASENATEIADYYFDAIRAEDQEQYKTYALFGFKTIYTQLSESAILEKINSPEAKRKALVQLHFERHSFFIEDGFIRKHIPDISHLPLYLVHGTEDPICLYHIAYDFANSWPGAILETIHGGGHLASDPGIEKALLRCPYLH